MPASITSLHKTGSEYWCSMVFNGHVSTGHKITIEELSKLECGMELMIEVQWNEGGQGQRTKLPRPLQILKRSKSEWVEL